MKATMDLTKDTMRDWSTRRRWTGLQHFSGGKKSGRERGGWSVSGRGMMSTTMVMMMYMTMITVISTTMITVISTMNMNTTITTMRTVRRCLIETMMNTATSSMMTETMKTIIMKTMFMIMITKKMAALGSTPMKTMTMGITSMFTYRFTMRNTILTDHIPMQITILMGMQRETMTMMKTITRITTMNIMKTITRIKTMYMIKTMTTTM